MQKLVFSLVLGIFAHQANAVSPIAKVLDMLTDLYSQIVSEGEVIQKEYAAFAEWCEDRSADLGYEIKTGKAEVESLQAGIAAETATIGSLKTKIEELAADTSRNEADLKEATTLRKKEATDFSAEEKELMGTIDMLERSISILEKEMQGGASMMQLKNAGTLVDALTVMVQASLIGSSDASTLTAFVQNVQRNQGEEEGDDALDSLGAPAPTAYKSQSGGIVDTLEDLAEKAESQLADVRKKETTALHNYQMLKQALDSEIEFANKDMDEAKRSSASSTEAKSSAEGDLEVTKKELAEDIKAKSLLHHDCMTKAEAFEAETKSRGEELKAIASAKKFLQESTTGAALAQTSFLQVARSSLKNGELSPAGEVLHLIRNLAHKQRSRALVQLASQIDATFRVAGGDDPFQKVKAMISDMISKLEEEAGEDAAKKAYCDKELSETGAKKVDKSNEIAKLSTRIEQMSAKSAMLKQQVAALESQLSKLLKSQAEMDKLRQQEKEEYDSAKAELEKSLKGVKLGLSVLNEYYGKADKSHNAAEGAANGIIGLLEVVEADLSKELAEITSDEEAAVVEYNEVTSENEIERAQKEQDAKYKTKEIKELDKTSAELTSDHSGVVEELSAVNTYLSRLQEECIAKPSTYEERTERRDSEIRGLKEALDILGDDASLLQRTSRRTLRGSRNAAQLFRD